MVKKTKYVWLTATIVILVAGIVIDFRSFETPLIISHGYFGDDFSEVSGGEKETGVCLGLYEGFLFRMATQSDTSNLYTHGCDGKWVTISKR